MSYHGTQLAKAEVVLFGGEENSDTDPLLEVKSAPSVQFFDITAVSKWRWAGRSSIHALERYSPGVLVAAARRFIVALPLERVWRSGKVVAVYP